MKMKEKEIKVLRVKPHEHPEVYMLKNTLEAMQEAVGGYIDIVGLDDNVCILLNDEGKLIGLEGNRRIGSDIIVGDFFVCGSDEEGNLTSLSEEELDTYWTIVNKKDTIFKYIFWERLDSLPIPESCFHFVWCQIA